MRVFQIRTNSDRYQCFETNFLYEHRYRAGPEGDLSGLYIAEPRLLRTDFYNISLGYLIISSRAADVLREHFELAGRILPFTYKGQNSVYVDAIPSVDALDYDRTIFRIGERSRVRLGIERYTFRGDQFPTRTSLFTLTQDPYLYVLEGRGGLSREFREVVEAELLVGLEFREIWNNDQEPQFCGTPWSIRDYLLKPENMQLRNELGIKDEDDADE